MNFFFGVGLLGDRLPVSILVSQHKVVGSEIVFFFIIKFSVLKRQVSWVMGFEWSWVVVWWLEYEDYFCVLLDQSDWL